MAATVNSPMLICGRPEGLQARPSALAYTPRSVPAATSVRAKAKARTERPSRPFTGPHERPSSLLASAPPPRRPASTKPVLEGLNAIVRTGAPAPCATFHVDPPSALLTKAPSDL